MQEQNRDNQDQMRASDASAMQALRTATAELHQRIEANPVIGKCFTTREGLAHLLARWYGFFVPFESQIARAATMEGLNWPGRSKVCTLMADLWAHGIAVDGLPYCRDVPHYATKSEILGALYVTEGASLGGQFLARRIEAELGLSSGVGYSFFTGYGERTAQRWKELRALIENMCGADTKPAVRAAVATFLSIERWLAA